LFLDKCGGCKYHKLPYTAQVPVKIDGKYVTREFKTKKDVWDVVDMIIEEERRNNMSQSLGVDSYYNISKQLPFFSCPTLFYNNESSKAISKYFYCKEFGIPPHKGSFSEQPNKWIEHSFFISNCISKLESIKLKEVKNK
tara:strand:+ start:360 stop:779 length:420 start_codon:yes stop_codon:yes gene_type:complete